MNAYECIIDLLCCLAIALLLILNTSCDCSKCAVYPRRLECATDMYEGWNFNFDNTPLDWIQELLE